MGILAVSAQHERRRDHSVVRHGLAGGFLSAKTTQSRTLLFQQGRLFLSTYCDNIKLLTALLLISAFPLSPQFTLKLIIIYNQGRMFLIFYKDILANNSSNPYYQWHPSFLPSLNPQVLDAFYALGMLLIYNILYCVVSYSSNLIGPILQLTLFLNSIYIYLYTLSSIGYNIYYFYKVIINTRAFRFLITSSN